LRNFLIFWSPALRFFILALIIITAFLIRVFSVIRYESIIHEFDPWFNYRTSQYLINNDKGLYGFNDYFDEQVWYPIGRAIKNTSFYGLMYLSTVLYHFARFIGFPIDARNICVFTGPFFSMFTALSTYLLTSEVTKRREAGLIAALLISFIPSYISRSVAGSYDYESIAIFLIVLVFYLWIKSINTGSIFISALAGLTCGYLSITWGGYTFVLNLIPCHVLFLIAAKRYIIRVYVAYNIFAVITLSFMIYIPIIGPNILSSSELLALIFTFFFLHLMELKNFIKCYASRKAWSILTSRKIISLLALGGIIVLSLIFMFSNSWSGRVMTLLDPTFAKKNIPIIYSVSEHQATTWGSYFHDLYFVLIFIPTGLYCCFHKPTIGKIFIGLYVICASYFSCVMIRLLLIFTPGACIAAAIGISKIIRNITKVARHRTLGLDVSDKKKVRLSLASSVALIMLIGWILLKIALYSNLISSD